MTAILVIAGGLGHFVQMLGALNALRSHHRDARIVLLIAPEAEGFAQAARLVDDIWCDRRRSPWHLGDQLVLRRQLRAVRFDRVYDLVGGTYGRGIFRLLYGWWPYPSAKPWSGDIPGMAYYTAPQSALHLRDRIAAQLKQAGVPEVPSVDLTWVARQVTSFNMRFPGDAPFVLLVSDPADNESRSAWPPEHWHTLAGLIADADLTPVLVGLKPAVSLNAALAEVAPQTLDLSGEASICDLVFLAWAARAAIGCDNGLMHVFAAAGCRSVVLYDALSDPARNGQRGPDVSILRRPHLADILPSEVMGEVSHAIAARPSLDFEASTRRFPPL